MIIKGQKIDRIKVLHVEIFADYETGIERDSCYVIYDKPDENNDFGLIKDCVMYFQDKDIDEW